MNKQDELKKLAAETAAKEVKDGMIVGLGTGSTAYFATKYLADQRINFTGVPTSVATEELARELCVPLRNPGEVSHIDIVIDGADEALETGEMIKGGGGALLREKIIANMAKRCLYVMDQSKLVPYLGKFPLPLEVNIFGHDVVMKQLVEWGYDPKLRLKKNEPYETENNNYIIDCHMKKIADPAAMEKELNMIPGVVENGLFVNIATELFIAGEQEVRHITLNAEKKSSSF